PADVAGHLVVIDHAGEANKVGDALVTGERFQHVALGAVADDEQLRRVVYAALAGDLADRFNERRRAMPGLQCSNEADGWPLRLHGRRPGEAVDVDPVRGDGDALG